MSFHVGPTLRDPSTLWHELHPLIRYRAAPTSCGAPRGVAHAATIWSYTSAGTTRRIAAISEWFAPQYSAQKTQWSSYGVPAQSFHPPSAGSVAVPWILVGSNQIVLYRFGKTSNFTRKSGTQKECSTSVLTIRSFTGRPSGITKIGVSCTPSAPTMGPARAVFRDPAMCRDRVISGLEAPLGYWSDQFHRWAVTTSSGASAGGTTMLAYPQNPSKNM